MASSYEFLLGTAIVADTTVRHSLEFQWLLMQAALTDRLMRITISSFEFAQRSRRQCHLDNKVGMCSKLRSNISTAVHQYEMATILDSQSLDPVIGHFDKAGF